jgi:hypothetical protein
MSTVSMAYAKLMLSAGSTTTGLLAAKATANPPASDDFGYAFTANGSGINVSVTAKSGGAAAGATAASKTWILP